MSKRHSRPRQSSPDGEVFPEVPPPEDKPEAPGALGRGRWRCPKCGFVNPARRKKCKDCKTPRPAGEESK